MNFKLLDFVQQCGQVMEKIYPDLHPCNCERDGMRSNVACGATSTMARLMGSAYPHR